MTDQTNACIPPNDDIDGIGVRLGFYMQTVASVSILWLSDESATASLFNLLILSVAYTVSVVVNVCKPLQSAPLYLYHVIQASYLIWLANLSQLIGFGVYSRKVYRRKHSPDKIPDKEEVKGDEEFGETMIGCLSSVQIIASWCLSVYMWVRASTIGGGSKGLRDSVQVYIIYSHKLQATSSGRVAALVSLSIIMAVYMPFLITRFIVNNIMWRPKFWKGQRRDLGTETRANTAAVILAERHGLPKLHQGVLQGTNEVPPTTHFPAFEAAWFFIYIPTFVGFVVAIEFQRTRNNLCDHSGTWGFGQITALLTSAWTMADVVKAGRKILLKRRHKVEDVVRTTEDYGV